MLLDRKWNIETNSDCQLLRSIQFWQNFLFLAVSCQHFAPLPLPQPGIRMDICTTFNKIDVINNVLKHLHTTILLRTWQQATKDSGVEYLPLKISRVGGNPRPPLFFRTEYSGGKPLPPPFFLLETLDQVDTTRRVFASAARCVCIYLCIQCILYMYVLQG